VNNVQESNADGQRSAVSMLLNVVSY